MRVNDAGVWMLEIAARPIGGLCSRVLRFESGVTLEEILLRHAIGEDVSKVRLESRRAWSNDDPDSRRRRLQGR